jgi:transketolase
VGISKELRAKCLRLAHKCQDGNLQSAFSCMEIIWALYDGVMKWSPETALSDDRDIFVVSKGQATLALFSVLWEKGFFKDADFEDIGSFGSLLSIQTDMTKCTRGGIENSAGSLGHGLPLAVGMAMANKIKKLDSRVFVLVGDGEFTEGTMWESCILASSKKLDNLTVIIDDNNSVGAMVDMGSMRKKLEAFGFAVREVDGHDLQELKSMLSCACILPLAIIAHTERGHGSKTLTSDPIWFHKSPNTEELEMMIKELT